MKTIKNGKTQPGLVIIMLALFALPSLAQSNGICQQGVRELQASLDVIQGRGGLWGFLEQTQGLKDKSMVGLQADGKLQRSIVILKTMCDEGKAPSIDAFKSIQDVLGDARMVFNFNDSTPPRTILDAINKLNEKAEKVINNLPQ